MRGFGQIAALCEIARLTLGVITAIGPVHLEFVESVEGVARAKAMLEALPRGAKAVVPAGSAELEPHLRGDLEVIRVGDDVRQTAFRDGRLQADVAVTRSSSSCRSRPHIRSRTRSRPSPRTGRSVCRSIGSGGRCRDRALPSPRRRARSGGWRPPDQRLLEREPHLDGRCAETLRPERRAQDRGSRRDGRAGAEARATTVRSARWLGDWTSSSVWPALARDYAPTTGSRRRRGESAR